MASAHIDTFARDRLPPVELQPQFVFDLPQLQFPAQLNCATELLDRHIEQGRGDRICLRAPGIQWTYRDLYERANRIAHVLVQEMGVVPGNRVLLRAPNHPMLVACWFAVIKVGAIAVATMPLLRSKELQDIVRIAQTGHALPDSRPLDDLSYAASRCEGCRQLVCLNGDAPDVL